MRSIYTKQDWPSVPLCSIWSGVKQQDSMCIMVSLDQHYWSPKTLSFILDLSSQKCHLLNYQVTLSDPRVIINLYTALPVHLLNALINITIKCCFFKLINWTIFHHAINAWMGYFYTFVCYYVQLNCWARKLTLTVFFLTFFLLLFLLEPPSSLHLVFLESTY